MTKPVKRKKGKRKKKRQDCSNNTNGSLPERLLWTQRGSDRGEKANFVRNLIKWNWLKITQHFASRLVSLPPSLQIARVAFKVIRHRDIITLFKVRRARNGSLLTQGHFPQHANLQTRTAALFKDITLGGNVLNQNKSRLTLLIYTSRRIGVASTSWHGDQDELYSQSKSQKKTKKKQLCVLTVIIPFYISLFMLSSWPWPGLFN